MFSSSGYGQQTLELLPLIRDAGYPVAASNFFGMAGGKFVLDSIMQYPVVNHTYGSDAMVLHGNDFQADVVFSLQDVWVLNPQDLQQVRRWIPITPIDHDPAPMPVVNNLKYAYRVISMSKHGQKALADKGVGSTYIPHTVNTDLFKPLNKIERKQQAGLPPDCYLVGMVCANKDNPPRKSIQEAIDAFKMFLEKEPKALLYIHANPDFPGGFQFKQYADFIGIGDRVLVPDFYQQNFNTSKEAMVAIFNTFNVLLAPSTAEGFGIPIIEAQACGIPVIVTDFTAMPELVVPDKTGYRVKVAYKRFTPQGSYVGVPDVTDIYNGLMALRRVDAGKTRDEARKWIVSNYDTKKVFQEKWLPYLSMLEREVYGEPVVDNTQPIADTK